MLQSKLFYKTTKETPREAEAISHKLLLRAGFIDQLMAGAYSFLPLGHRVIKKIENIIRRNMILSPVSGQEILMPALTPKENWLKTGRWNNFEALFKLKGQGDKDYALAATHEEVIVPLAKKIISSYKDLPLYLFQIQTKFRNEARAKSGLMRTREFIMKDLYSFHVSQEDLDNYYDKVSEVYFKIFKECGILTKGKNRFTFKTWASGGSFSKYSHEYQTITESGEDIIYICKKCGAAINKEIKSQMTACPEEKCGSTDFEEKKAVEVGNIFKLGTKYSLPFDLKFRSKDGKENPVIIGCYGIGLGRLMAAMVEVNNDDKGIIWPKEAAPFLVHLVQLENSGKVKKAAKEIYQNLQKNNIEVLYDDREDKSAGEKLTEADLIGIPYRVVVSERTLSKKSIELKKRDSGKINLIKENQLLKFLN
ncbi:prolyl-tRNA synthetase [Patescibacteria group bacterium]|nr:prolyl-tRNA synthetase [Patescibacteria group bacterium]MCG2699846.1 His/Gly/Thr/Pro-type tRNA ligase C-terminal domain-containing protein [Candidatus Parcubacteria bacterium]